MHEISWFIDDKKYLIEILSWTPYDPGRTSGDPLSCYPPEGGEGEWRFVDPDTGEEVFPELSYQELREIENFIFEEMEGDNR